MSTCAPSSMDTNHDGVGPVVDKEQRKKKRRKPRNRRSKNGSGNAARAAGRGDQPSSHSINQPASKDNAQGRPRQPVASNEGGDGWTVAGKKKKNTRGRKKQSVKGNKGGRAARKHDGANTRKNQKARKDVVADSVQSVGRKEAKEHRARKSRENSIELQDDGVGRWNDIEDQDSEQSEEQYEYGVEQRQNGKRGQSTSEQRHMECLDTSNSNTTTSSTDEEPQPTETTQMDSNLDPEIADFDPNRATVQRTAAHHKGALGQCIQMQLFGTLQALNLQQQYVQNQIDAVLQPQYVMLSSSLATMRAQNSADHLTYHLLREQQQAVGQQIRGNQNSVMQIAEQIQYTRDAYNRQVEQMGRLLDGQGQEMG